MSGSGDLQPNSGLRYHTDADSPLPETINPIIDAVESHLADIVQTTEVNSSTKYPSAAVTYSLQNQIRSRLDWKLVPGGGVGIGGNKSITTDTPFTEIMLIGSLANSVLYYRAVQERSASSLIEKNSTSPSGSVLKTGCQITGDSKAYIVCSSGSDEGVTAIFYR